MNTRRCAVTEDENRYQIERDKEAAKDDYMEQKLADFNEEGVMSHDDHDLTVVEVFADVFGESIIDDEIYAIWDAIQCNDNVEMVKQVRKAFKHVAARAETDINNLID